MRLRRVTLHLYTSIRHNVDQSFVEVSDCSKAFFHCNATTLQQNVCASIGARAGGAQRSYLDASEVVDK